MYETDMPTTAEWWTQWKAFMFGTELTTKGKKGPETKKPCQMLGKISKAKYVPS